MDRLIAPKKVSYKSWTRSKKVFFYNYMSHRLQSNDLLIFTLRMKKANNLNEMCKFCVNIIQ